MSVQPRSPDTLNHTVLFDDGCAKSRLEELTKLFIKKFELEEAEKIWDKAKRQFKTPPTFNYIEAELEIMYGKRAREEAEKVLEAERQAYVSYLSDYIKTNLTRVSKQLRFMVYAINEKGEPYKLKIIVEKMFKALPKGDGYYECEEEYVGEHDFDRLNQINLTRGRLNEFKDYEPYLSEELKKLWVEAQDLATLERVKKEAKGDAEKEQGSEGL